MISRTLWNRLKRLEDKMTERCEPEMTLKERQLIQRLYAAKRRMALEDGVEYDGPEPIAETICKPEPPDPLIMILNAARKRMNEEENARLKQKVATDGSEHNTSVRSRPRGGR